VELSIVNEPGTEPSDTERSLAEGIGWVNQLGPYTAEYHEVMGHLAMMAARDHWRQADLFRQLAAEREARLAKAAARRAARERADG
jgi:hypothetical protein